MKSFGGISISTMTSIVVDEAMLTMMPSIVNSIPNAPPILKAGVELAIGLGQIEIAGKIAKRLPSPAGPIVKGMLEIQGAMVAIQAIPNLIASLGGMGIVSGGQ